MHSVIKGMFYLILAYICFSLLNIISKKLYDLHIDLMVITFYRGLFCTIIFLPFVIGKISSLKNLKILKINYYKGTIDFLSIPVWIIAISNINIPEAVALSYLTPTITAFLTIFLLKDKFTTDKWIVLILGLIGVIIIIKPDVNNLNYYVACVFMACLLWASGSILTKNLTNTQHPVIIVFLTNLIITVLAFPFFIFKFYLIDINELMLCISMSLMAGCGYYLLSKAYSCTKLSNLIPMDYLRLIFATITAYIFFNQRIEINTIAGSILIFSGTLYLIHNQLKQK